MNERLDDLHGDDLNDGDSYQMKKKLLQNDNDLLISTPESIVTSFSFSTLNEISISYWISISIFYHYSLNALF